MLFTEEQLKILKHNWLIVLIVAVLYSIGNFFKFDFQVVDMLFTVSVGILVIYPAAIREDKPLILGTAVFILVYAIFRYYYFSELSESASKTVLNKKYLSVFLSILPLFGLFRGLWKKNILQGLLGYGAGLMLMNFSLPISRVAMLALSKPDSLVLDIEGLLSVFGMLFFLLPFLFVIENLSKQETQKETMQELFSYIRPIDAKEFSKRFSVVFYIFFGVSLSILFITLIPKSLVDIRSRSSVFNLSMIFLAPFLILLTRVISSLLVRRIKTLGEQISWSYFFSFIPFINFFPFTALKSEKSDIITPISEEESLDSTDTPISQADKNFVITFFVLLAVYYLFRTFYGYPVWKIRGAAAFYIGRTVLIGVPIALFIFKQSKKGVFIVSVLTALFLSFVYLSASWRVPYAYWLANFSWFVSFCIFLRPLVCRFGKGDDDEIVGKNAFIYSPVLISLILSGIFVSIDSWREVKSEKKFSDRMLPVFDKIDNPKSMDVYHFSLGSLNPDIHLKVKKIEDDSINFYKLSGDNWKGMNIRNSCVNQRIVEIFEKKSKSAETVWITKEELKKCVNTDKNKPHGHPRRKVKGMNEGDKFARLVRINRMGEPNLHSNSSSGGGRSKSVAMSLKNSGGPTRLRELKVVKGDMKFKNFSQEYLPACGSFRLQGTSEKGIPFVAHLICTESYTDKQVIFELSFLERGGVSCVRLPDTN